MGGHFYCEEYRRRFIADANKDKVFNLKLSRFYFARDIPFWHYPPFCLYGYECKKCIQVQLLWQHCCQPDFEDIYQQVITGNIQLTLF